MGANFAVILGGTAGAAYAGLRWRWRVWSGVAAGLVGYATSAAVVTLITARALGYPVWMGVRL